MKLLLVNPTRVGIDSYSTPPLHLMYLKKAVEGVPAWTCEIIDVNYEINRRLKILKNVNDVFISSKKTIMENEWIEKILARDFDILGIGGIVPSYHFSERLISRMEKGKPSAWLIVGGGLGLPLKNLWAKTGVHYLVEGDAEKTLIDILKAYPERNAMKAISGVYYRDARSWKGSAPALPANLDYIPYPEWNEIDYEYFMRAQKGWVADALPRRFYADLSEIRVLPIVMTRGCPYSCTFCFHFNRSHRKHSVAYMMDYITHLQKDFGVNMLQTWDDLIITDRKWFLELCEALKKRSSKIRIFMSGGKPNLIDGDMVRHMREAGVARISYGIESGSPAILKEMRKMATVDDNRKAVLLTVESGIHTHMNMVIGMPGETEKTLRETKKFIFDLQKNANIGSDNVSFSFATAYPGTELFDVAVSKGLVKDVGRYVVSNKGVGNYTLDLCGLGERRLKKFIESMLIMLDCRELLRQPSIKRIMKIFAIRIPKYVIKFYLPENVFLALTHIRQSIGAVRRRISA